MNKQEMANKAAEILCKMFYEDVEFIYKFIVRLARKKGLLKDQESKEVTA